MPFARFLYGLGIRYVGKETAEAIATEFTSFENMWQYLKQSVEDTSDHTRLRSVQMRSSSSSPMGISSKAVSALLHLSRSPSMSAAVDDLLQEVTVLHSASPEIPKDPPTTHPSPLLLPLQGKTVVFTGRMLRFTRKQAEDTCRALGGTPTDTVSEKVWMVVAGSGTNGVGDEKAQRRAGLSSKLQKAMKFGVQVVSEEEWLRVTRQP